MGNPGSKKTLMNKRQQKTSVKAIVSAIAFIIVVLSFAFSLWTECGPYAWTASAQVALFGAYSLKLTFIITLVIYVMVAVLLWCVFAGSSRVIEALAFGIPALLVLVYFAITAHLLFTGGTQVDSSSQTQVLQAASLIPQGFTLESSNLHDLDIEHSVTTEIGFDKETYVPFKPSVWPDSQTPVVLKVGFNGLKELSEKKPLNGIIQKEPLPLLFRRAWTENHSLFAIVLDNNHTSVRAYFASSVVLFIIFISVAIWFLWTRRAHISSLKKGD
jgi:hypothetical protein